MKKMLYLVICLGLVAPMIGCATGGSSIFQNGCCQSTPGPIRSTIRSWFQGDACSTCNPPAGQLSNCGTNFAPLCDSCGHSAIPTTVGTGVNTPPVQYYGETNLNGPATSFESPVIQSPAPLQNVPTPAPASGSSTRLESRVESLFGASSTESVVPPQF